MGKGANKNLLNTSGETGARARQEYGPLNGTLMGDLADPKGYTPQQLAYMNTASQQSLGGSVAGATGQANLQAARTRNAGGYQGAIGLATRSAQRQLSQNALKIQQDQANLQQAQREAAIQALSNLYKTNIDASVGALGEVKQSPNTFSSILNSLSGAAKTGAEIAAM